MQNSLSYWEQLWLGRNAYAASHVTTPSFDVPVHVAYHCNVAGISCNPTCILLHAWRKFFMNLTHISSILRVVGRRFGTTLAVILVIVYLTQFGLSMAARGSQGVSAPLLDVAGESLQNTATYFVQHPSTYFWQKQTQPAFDVVWTLLLRSAGLLLASLLIATLIGVPAGIAVATSKHARRRTLALLAGTIGISTPSFILAMLFWVINIAAHRTFNIDALPQTGFGWDAHLIMPALVLAARPLAQLVQITNLTLTDVLAQDFVRVAYGKGLSTRKILWRHALRNVWIPVLTTLGTSLRFSLASLPVVESFFFWPGIGLALLQTIEAGNHALTTDLVVALGLLFLSINLALELLFPLLDPRLRAVPAGEVHDEPSGARASLSEKLRDWRAAWQRLRAPREPLPPLAAHEPAPSVANDARPKRSSSRVVRSVLQNPTLMVGGLLAIGLLVLVVAGSQLTSANPYETHGVMTIEGKIGAPPYAPSSVFPWGSDPVGRDIRALIFAGARQTLMLAFFATLVRVLIGATLGALAGWWRNGWLDRLVNGAVSVWAAYPVTLFAMIVILGLGIQQGMWVFVIGLSVVAWGEIAQFVRGQVVALKPQPFIEAARATGARTRHLLSRHVLSVLLPSLLTLAVLEMAGVLMLLAELGFLNIFMGGGFKAAIAETGRMQAVVYYFSDVPEWSALLANVRNWWRGQPWLGWYPGLAFFLAILTFNFLGAGLRRFLDDSRVNVSRIFNRYTVVGGLVAVASFVWLLRASSPLGVYQSEAAKFDATRALADAQALAAPEFAGRETGTPGARAAAEHIAQQMADIGLFPAGQKETFLIGNTTPRPHVLITPTLNIVNSEGNATQAFVYRRDFVEFVGRGDVYTRRSSFGAGTGIVVGLVTGPDPETAGADRYKLGQQNLRDKILLTRAADVARINTAIPAGILVVTDDSAVMQRKMLYNNTDGSVPIMFVMRAVADQLLQPTGLKFSELEKRSETLEVGKFATAETTTSVQMAVDATSNEKSNEEYVYVVGFIPGEGAVQGLDSQAIFVSAYYDGLGIGPDGTRYPGANDNASGVATMLELARALKTSPVKPKKTVVFVAWPGGERGEGFSIANATSGKIGFSSLRPEAVIELSGVGAGSGNAVALGQGSSFRLVQLFQDAASRLGVDTTTRGRGPHAGEPLVAGFGGRDALTIYVHWDGADEFAHTPRDDAQTLDPTKLQRVGQTTLLTLITLAREVNY